MPSHAAALIAFGGDDTIYIRNRDGVEGVIIPPIKGNNNMAKHTYLEIRGYRGGGGGGGGEPNKVSILNFGGSNWRYGLEVRRSSQTSWVRIDDVLTGAVDKLDSGTVHSSYSGRASGWTRRRGRGWGPTGCHAAGDLGLVDI